MKTDKKIAFQKQSGPVCWADTGLCCANSLFFHYNSLSTQADTVFLFLLKRETIGKDLTSDENYKTNVLQQTMKRRLKLTITVVLLALVPSVRAQVAAVKTNLLNDALLSPGLGVEVGLAPRWTIDVSGQMNAWSISGHKWKHWLVQPEVRYWFCRRFAGHFVGAHLIGGQYNFTNLGFGFKFLGSDFRKLNNRRYQGWGTGAGIAYGYDWILGRHWNMEAEIAFGWIYTRFDSYPCAQCGRKIDSNRPHHYIGPTKAALNIVYLF